MAKKKAKKKKTKKKSAKKSKRSSNGKLRQGQQRPKRKNRVHSEARRERIVRVNMGQDKRKGLEFISSANS